jgi:hypothetical protein
LPDGGREYPPEGPALREGAGGRSDQTGLLLFGGADPIGRLGEPFPELPEEDGRGVNFCHPSLPRLCACTDSCAGRFIGAADPRFIGAGEELWGRAAGAEEDGLEKVCHPPELPCVRLPGPGSFLTLPAFGCLAGALLFGCGALPRNPPAALPDAVGGRGVPNRSHPEFGEAVRALFVSTDPRGFALIPRFSAAGLFTPPRFACVPMPPLLIDGRPLLVSTDPRFAFPRFSATGLFNAPRLGCVPPRPLSIDGRVFDTAPAPSRP